MEASATVQQNPGLSNDVLRSAPEQLANTAKSITQKDTGRPTDQNQPSEVFQAEFEEPTTAPAQVAHEKAPSDVNLHSKPSLSAENHNETSFLMNLPEGSPGNDALMPSASQAAAEKPSVMSRLTDAPSDHEYEEEFHKPSMANNQSLNLNKTESTGKIFPRAIHHTEPPPEAPPVGDMKLTKPSSMSSPQQVDIMNSVEEGSISTNPEFKLTLMQDETKPSSSCLDDRHLSTSSDRSSNVLMEHSDKNLAHLSSEQFHVGSPMDQSESDAIIYSNADPFTETDHGRAERPTERHLTEHSEKKLAHLSSEQSDVEPPIEQPEMGTMIHLNVDPSERGTEKQLTETHHDEIEKPDVSSVICHPGNQHEVGRILETLDATISPGQQGSKELPFVQEPIQSRQNIRRAEIDTAAPFESVKAAVSLFGERMDWKSLTRPSQMQSVERHVLSESELQKAHDDLVHYKDQLALIQASTAGILLELKKVKRLIQSPGKPGDTDNLSDKSKPVNTWLSTELISPDKPDNELVDVLREVEIAKEELILVTVSKDQADKGLENAVTSMNSVLKRVSELSAEKMSLDETVADAHIALADAEEHVALLKSGQKVESLHSVPTAFIEKKSAEIRGLELKLEEANTLIMNLKDELSTSKKVDSVLTTASETELKIIKVKLELDQAKSEELNMVGKLATVLEESDDMKAKLEEAGLKNASLSASVQALRSDMEANCKELESMHEKEHIACAALASLQEELQTLKEALRSAQGSELSALEAKDTLPTAIKESASAADLAKAAAVASKEEVRRARQEIEQAKAATSTAMSRQQAALKELEAARASEGMALAELKALTESESQSSETASLISEGIVGVSISLEEYSALKHAAVEAEGLGAQKVAEVTALVEDAKASQEKTQSKLEEAVKESEKGREELSKAQSQENDAQEAKVTAEGELRKWRAEHDLRRKSGGAPLDPKSNVMRHPSRKNSEDEYLDKYSSYNKEEVLLRGKTTASRDSLAQIMTLEPHTPDRLERPAIMEDSKDRLKGKKRNIIRRLTALVAMKKKS